MRTQKTNTEDMHSLFDPGQCVPENNLALEHDERIIECPSCVKDSATTERLKMKTRSTMRVRNVLE
jgi:hypothetical protein